MAKYPWLDTDTKHGQKEDPNYKGRYIWDWEGFPFVVRWSLPVNDRLTRWRTECRQFATLEEAVTQYKRGFTGLSVDLVKHNGGKPGQHLTTLAYRKATKATKWHDSVPLELRGN
jgi:hypothetical protein